MGDTHKPKRGSMAFSPRKRANRHFGRVKSWPDTDSKEVRVQGFAGWKAGMTHVLMRDTNTGSPSSGQEVRKAVTVVEVPPMRVLGVRGYHMTVYGMQTSGEAWADSEKLSESIPELSRRVPQRVEHDSDAHHAALCEKAESGRLCEVRLIAATQPHTMNSTSSKKPELMEMGLTGGDIQAQLAWAKEQFGSEIGIDQVYLDGSDIDVVGITKGKGWQGSVKRFGVKLLSHKNSKRRRQGGNMGDFGTGYVRKTIRQAGQLGYHQRTEFNKRILRISNPEDNEITPDGGFLHYGEVRNPYIIIQGSLPGPAKRLLRFRDAVRPRKGLSAVEITYVSTASKQGV